jgi:hypothetical protein
MNEWLTLFAAIIITTFRDYICYHVMPEDSPTELVVLVWILSDWDSFMRLVVCVERCLFGCNIPKSTSEDDYSYLLMVLELSIK